MVRLEPVSLLLAPSTRNRLLVVELPLTEKSTPESKPLNLLSKLFLGRNTRLEQGQCGEVAPVERQLLDLLGIDDFAQRRIVKLHLNRAWH